MNIQDINSNITKRPYVKSLRLEKDERAQRTEDVLVIETDINFSETEFNARDERLIDLLISLDALQREAAQSIGRFDRIDIR